MTTTDRFARTTRASARTASGCEASCRNSHGQPARSTRTHVTYRVSVETLQTSFVRLESAPARSGWGPAGEGLFDLAEGETANSVHSLNALLGSPTAAEEDRPELRETSLDEELLEISPDLDQRWRGALPVMAIRFGPTLDEHNAAPAGQAFAMPVLVQRQAGAPAAKLRDLDLDVSYDDGATWQPVHLVRTGDRGLALLFHPKQGDFVALRASATDGAGNSVRQTILHAYRLRP